MEIAIFGSSHHTETLAHIQQVINFLSAKKVAILVEQKLYNNLSANNKNVHVFNAHNNIRPNFALSFGGDGTFLTTASYIGSKNIPILGINCGRLGFLADVANQETENILNCILQNQYTIEERTVLELKTSSNIGEGIPFGLNEIAVLKQDSSSMISIDAYINNEHLNTYQADGLIVATPTGSTAYSMSVGGPLMVPQAKNLILAPVASHSLNVRPLVIPDNWEIRLKINSRSHSYLVSIDGRSQVFPQQTALIIKTAPYTIKVIKPTDHSFFKSLKNKLMWGADTRIK